MRIHIVADKPEKLATTAAQLEGVGRVTTALLGARNKKESDLDAVVIAVDLRDADRIAALKELLRTLQKVNQKIFLIEQGARVVVMQAYALGATSVATFPCSRTSLLKELLEFQANDESPEKAALPEKVMYGAQETASIGAQCITSIFSSVMNGMPIDMKNAREVGGKITASITEHGLSNWLDTVKRHHEGTFQHCLLVTGVAVDFALSLGMSKGDIERLCLAAMFHDVGKATIPLAVLDKPGKLDDGERRLIERHPVAGYEVLKQNTDISEEILDAVRHHHEYLDGSGYPDALRAEDISDLVRMLTICDIFAALIERRSYKPTMPRDRAYGILESMEGKLEKPLVAAFKEVALSR